VPSGATAHASPGHRTTSTRRQASILESEVPAGGKPSNRKRRAQNRH
jgi:hypothetical protein